MNEQNNTGLALQPKEVGLNQVTIARTMGELAYKSGIFKASKAEAAAMIMLKGYELGFPMTASAEFINVIEGTVGLTPRGALALMHNRSDVIKSIDFQELEKDGKYFGCRCTIVRVKNGKDAVYTKQFTMEDAERAGLVKDKSGWEKYPQQMCQWRALGFCADIACPDILAGMTDLMKMPEIVYDEDIASFADTEQVPVIETVEATPQINLSDLIARYGAEKVLAANNNILPRNNEECAQIAEILEGAK